MSCIIARREGRLSWSVGPLTAVDNMAYRSDVNAYPVALTRMEFRTLTGLMCRMDRVTHWSDLLDYVYPEVDSAPLTAMHCIIGNLSKLRRLLQPLGVQVVRHSNRGTELRILPSLVPP